MRPRADPRHAGIFDTMGIVKGSDRIEPLIFFSMGIHDVGSMRQRGRQPIKMVGCAYFDDPDIFDGNFEFK